MNPNFERTTLLLGPQAMARLGAARVLVLGVGGVGSWCVEALARSGIGTLTLVDPDAVAVSNINRQMPATTLTVGIPKVTVMARRVQAINPQCRLTASTVRYEARTANSFDLEAYDVVVDAIDSVADKALLIERVTHARRPRLVSSMGAARKTDIDQITVARFDDVRGCPLARAVRDRLRRTGQRPGRPFWCVYSPQLASNARTADGACGTVAWATAAFGLRLAQLAAEAIIRRPQAL